MDKIKIFYSYCRQDERDRIELEKHLVVLKDKEIIDDWSDRKIEAGEVWNESIENELKGANLVLLLISPDFLASQACKKELDMAIELNKEGKSKFIPVIIRNCPWNDIDDLSKIQALPKDAKPIAAWDDTDAAWLDVYNGIKQSIEKIRKNIKPSSNTSFTTSLLISPLNNINLVELFFYPDILATNKKNRLKLENNEIDSECLKKLDEFENKHVLIEAEEQSRKTSLCNMLYKHYVDSGDYPILLNGKNIPKNGDIKTLIDKEFNRQYTCPSESLFGFDKNKRILLIDDMDKLQTNRQQLINYIESIQQSFDHIIIFIDKVFNLSEKSTEHNYFSSFETYTLRRFGYKKRDELIKKCIAHDNSAEFDNNDVEQLKRLDKNSNDIKTIIGSNIVPSYPVFIITIFQTFELATPQDLSQTSYGHCYHAMITINLNRWALLYFGSKTPI